MFALPRPDRRLTVALAGAFLWHGGLVVSGSYRGTYDAWIHMFFADHYARNWFSTWETRWYTGFTVTSYPPGTHQLMAALSRVLGLEGAFMVVQIASVLILVVGVYRFSQIWVTRPAAGWAALLAVVSTSIAEVVHVFGQLPTSFSLGLLLNTLPSIFAWVARASWRHLLVAVCGLAATTAGHHVTTLFGTVFFVGPVIATAVIDALRQPRPGEPAGHSLALDRRSLWGAATRRLRRILPATIRAGVVGVAAICVLVVVVLPYWLWSSSDPIVQVPIPHASRDDFLDNTAAGIVFFAVPWGAMLALFPFAVLRGLLSRAVPLVASAGLLFLLGTGGTTPIPRLLLRGAFDILTLDRFTIWATIAILPMAGSVVLSIVSGRLRVLIQGWLGTFAWRGLVIGGAALMIGLAVLAANFAQFRPLQPDPIDPDPIAAFMAKDQHDRWRYLTLGFGDQMAIVSAATTATTVDGNYHSARRLPELTSRSVERLEGAKFRGVPGIGSLQQFLATPERYNLKFVFSNDVFYDPLLWGSGWHRLDRLENGIVIWEREDIPPLPATLPTRELPRWQRIMWGTLPMTAVAAATSAFAWTAFGQPAPNAILRRARRLAVFAKRTPPVRIFAAVDRWLERGTQRAPAGAPRPSMFGELRYRFNHLLTPPASPSRRLQLVVVAGTLLVLASLVVARNPAPTSSPEVAIEAYYDDLDFRRFDDAWNALVPATRPSFDQYQLELSVQDGLVASYGKLDSVETSLIERSDSTALVATKLTFITPLAEYHVERTHSLRLVNSTWLLVADQSDVSTTPDQFARSTEVTYLSQGRRQVTTEATLFGDVLDRPRIHVLSARAVEADGRYAVVGEVTNLDVDPADLTVTARFLDEQGETIVEHNASLVTIHKVLPRETVPFRIDLETIAGDSKATTEVAGDFHPDLFAAPNIEVEDIASIDLIAKAVVTGRDLERDLHAQNLRVRRSPTGDLTLVGELRNDGTRTATVPHVLVTQLLADGTVGWVDHVWVDAAVRPQRKGPFAVALTRADSLREVDVPLRVFGNGVSRGEGVPFASDATISLQGDGEFAAARIAAHAFYRAN